MQKESGLSGFSIAVQNEDSHRKKQTVAKMISYCLVSNIYKKIKHKITQLYY